MVSPVPLLTLVRLPSSALGIHSRVLPTPLEVLIIPTCIMTVGTTEFLMLKVRIWDMQLVATDGPESEA